jgi:hypothetical protein
LIICKESSISKRASTTTIAAVRKIRSRNRKRKNSTNDASNFHLVSSSCSSSPPPFDDVKIRLAIPRAEISHLNIECAMLRRDESIGSPPAGIDEGGKGSSGLLWRSEAAVLEFCAESES